MCRFIVRCSENAVGQSTGSSVTSSDPFNLAETVSHCSAERMMWLLSVTITERVFLPQDTSTIRPSDRPSVTNRFIGADSGEATVTTRSTHTVFPNPIFTNFIAFIPVYSRFCICSRIFSRMFFISTTRFVISMSDIFEPMVLTSRLTSWKRKSSFLPTASSDEMES